MHFYQRQQRRANSARTFDTNFILQNLLERNQGDIFFSYLQTADAIYGRCICDNSEIGGWVGRAIELSCDGALFEIRHVQQWSNTFPAV